MLQQTLRDIVSEESGSSSNDDSEEDMGSSSGDVGEVPVTQVKRCWKDWRMICDVGDAAEGLANEALLILQLFRRHFTYVIGTLPTSQALHLHHMHFTYVIC